MSLGRSDEDRASKLSAGATEPRAVGSDTIGGDSDRDPSFPFCGALAARLSDGLRVSVILRALHLCQPVVP